TNKVTAPMARRWMRRPAAIPIKTYRTDQTGPNNHEGGFPGGFIRSWYHSPPPFSMVRPTALPRPRQTSATRMGHSHAETFPEEVSSSFIAESSCKSPRFSSLLYLPFDHS